MSYMQDDRDRDEATQAQVKSLQIQVDSIVERLGTGWAAPEPVGAIVGIPMPFGDWFMEFYDTRARVNLGPIGMRRHRSMPTHVLFATDEKTLTDLETEIIEHNRLIAQKPATMMSQMLGSPIIELRECEGLDGNPIVRTRVRVVLNNKVNEQPTLTMVEAENMCRMWANEEARQASSHDQQVGLEDEF